MIGEGGLAFGRLVGCEVIGEQRNQRAALAEEVCSAHRLICRFHATSDGCLSPPNLAPLSPFPMRSVRLI